MICACSELLLNLVSLVPKSPQQISHDGNPVLRWNLGNISVSLDDNNNYKLSKKKSRDKIDGIIALVMGLGRWMVTAGSETTTETTGAGIEFL